MNSEKVVFVDETLEASFNYLSEQDPIKKMLKNLLTSQQAMENDLLLSITFPNLQEQIVLGYSSQIFLSSTTSIFSLSKFVASYGVLNPNFEIKKGLIRAIQAIKENTFCGRNVKKKLLPLSLIQKYNINNLWIYNLPDGWRMLYALTSSEEIQIIAVILDWMNHKDYERLFGF